MLGHTIASFVILMCLTRYKACVALLRKGSQVVVPGFLNPGWDILRRARIAGQHSQHTTHRQRFHPTDQLHEGAWAKAAACVNLLINRNICQFWHRHQLLSAVGARLIAPKGWPQEDLATTSNSCC